MTDPASLTRQTDRIAMLMGEKLGLKGRDLGQLARRGGRRLPRSVRRDLAVLAETEAKMANPRLAVTLDLKRPSEAAERVIAHLRAIDVADRRKGLILSILGSMAFSVLVVLALLVIVLVWRGFV